VTGVASDPGAAASGVGGTQIQIKRVVAGDCWGGGAWGANCTTESSWLTPVAGTPWTKNAQLPAASNLPGGLEDGLADAEGEGARRLGRSRAIVVVRGECHCCLLLVVVLGSRCAPATE
jgi:hypothetical protein